MYVQYPVNCKYVYKMYSLCIATCKYCKYGIDWCNALTSISYLYSCT